MKRGLMVLFAFSILIFACPPPPVSQTPDRVIEKKGWVLEIWVTAKGTRSEGHVTHLYHNGSEVCPIGGKREIVTPLGKLRYIEGKMPWNWHGWKPVSLNSL